MGKFKEQLKRTFSVSAEKLARNLSSVFVNIMTFYFIILFLGLFYFFSLESGSREVLKVMFYTLIPYCFVIFALGMYAGYKFVSKPETLEPKSKCEILKIQRYPMPMLLVSLMIMVLVLLIQTSLSAVGINSLDNELSYRITTSMIYVAMFLSVSSILIFPVSFQVENRGIICLSLIEDFEKAVEGDPFPIRVWNMLFKNAIRDTELFVRNATGVSKVDFYKPFNTVSLALAMGNQEEVSSAKKWIATLIQIMEKKDADGMQRAKQIFNHLDSAESLFQSYQNIHNKFKLQYSMEPVRLRRLSGKMVKVIEFVLGVVSIVMAIIFYYLSQVH